MDPLTHYLATQVTHDTQRVTRTLHNNKVTPKPTFQTCNWSNSRFSSQIFNDKPLWVVAPNHMAIFSSCTHELSQQDRWSTSKCDLQPRPHIPHSLVTLAAVDCPVTILHCWREGTHQHHSWWPAGGLSCMSGRNVLYCEHAYMYNALLVSRYH